MCRSKIKPATVFGHLHFFTHIFCCSSQQWKKAQLCCILNCQALIWKLKLLLHLSYNSMRTFFLKWTRSTTDHKSQVQRPVWMSSPGYLLLLQIVVRHSVDLTTTQPFHYHKRIPEKSYKHTPLRLRSASKCIILNKHWFDNEWSLSTWQQSAFVRTRDFVHWQCVPVFLWLLNAVTHRQPSERGVFIDSNMQLWVNE